MPGNDLSQAIPTPIDGEKHEGEMTMRTSRWRSRNWFLFAGSTVAAALAVAAAGLAAPALARPSAPVVQASIDSTAPGYPPPKGIYKPFTNCPIARDAALMNESVGGDAVGCIAGQIHGGSVKIGNITTPVTEPVSVQFGIWDPQNATPGGDNTTSIEQFTGGVLPPPAGLSAMVATKPDLIPQSLTTVLGCPSSDATVENICQQAAANPADNQVSALAQGAGQLTNFALFTWTQRVKFKLVNPLLGNNCYIGSDNNPIVLNPQVSLGPGGQFLIEEDPEPTVHPSTVVLALEGAVAADNTFFAPGVTGCGPGGSDNIAVDQALDAGAGLPAASGTNSFTFTGNLFFADNFASANQASILLSAFKDSTSGGKSARRHISPSHVIGHFGLK
jgi:hypothetical protein